MDTYKIVLNGKTISTHETLDAAVKRLRALQSYRCGICATTNEENGGHCRHGRHTSLNDTQYYNARIE